MFAATVIIWLIRIVPTLLFVGLALPLMIGVVLEIIVEGSEKSRPFNRSRLIRTVIAGAITLMCAAAWWSATPKIKVDPHSSVPFAPSP